MAIHSKHSDLELRKNANALLRSAGYRVIDPLEEAPYGGLNKSFTIWMRRDLIICSLAKIESEDGMCENDYAQALEGEKKYIMGCDIPDDKKIISDLPHFEQRLNAVWRFRRENSVKLAKQLKLFKSKQFAVHTGTHAIWQSTYVMTKFGRFFQRMPRPLQSSLIAIFLVQQRFAVAATRFKWVAGVVSFTTLAIKVWHSGLIGTGWIAFSAALGLFMGAVAAAWK